MKLNLQVFFIKPPYCAGHSHKCIKSTNNITRAHKRPETTVYILQCHIEAVHSIRALSFRPCAGSLAVAALLRNCHSHYSAIVPNFQIWGDASEVHYGVLCFIYYAWNIYSFAQWIWNPHLISPMQMKSLWQGKMLLASSSCNTILRGFRSLNANNLGSLD